MFSTIKNAWKIPDLRNKILYTLLMLVIFRLGANIPVPGIDGVKLASLFSNDDGLLSIFNLMSGGAFKNFTLFALGISPYITASIILNLLQIAIPSLEQLAKQGEVGRKKIVQMTRYGTVVLALIQGIGFSIGIYRNAFVDFNALTVAIAVITLTAGTAFLMYLGEHITEKGIGNGISLFIFAGIVARLPDSILTTINGMLNNEINIISVLIFIVVALFIIAGVIMIQQGTRKIPVQYAKRVVGRKMYGGQNTHIPLKVNQAGVIPVIFAISILSFPQTIASFMPNSGFATFIGKWFASNGVAWTVSQLLLIIFFTYFYTSVSFNPFDIAENMKKNGGFIPGIRPGKPTVEYLQRSVSRLTLVGALFLGFIAVLPNVILNFTDLSIQFGGTSLLIVVGVALETSRQIEAQMTMRHYQGFLK
ncbi:MULTISPECIES: preprotein translocase subunit SecY [unclassified Fusibacter]|uniref:preprotein translocase subunit SecY n=1 Tax=unclassified Fusibacter TaxID=2624464 RepID=UPI001012C174|nr:MULTISPECIES: preprotein translocase subunit SecY [unclassified Fusibacter]MCK8061532.1 preprotein translocase subunit SecY [Fusibacter sp. A2]NPE23740.1 preprotein translocase subunit SecY [Fusibacter sp. A1]RXV58767.1 preprotein translocase subunit SecY [Fusibacter sp. A1]